MTRDDCAAWKVGDRSMPDYTPAGKIIQGEGETAEGSSSANNKVTACPTSNVLVTPYNTNNGQRGCMFDVLATNTVTISCFDANLYSGTTADYEIYYRPGTHVGSENNSAAWTFLGGTTSLTSAGNNVPTAIPINFSVVIPAGLRYSFYVTNTFGGGTSYTDGAAVGNFLGGDANITIYEGVGKSYPFGLTFTVRNFNGHTYYNLGGVLNEGVLNLNARAARGGVMVGWTASEKQGLATLERAVNGGDFAELDYHPDATLAGSWTDSDVMQYTNYAYRIRVDAPNGEVHYSNTVEVTSEAIDALHQIHAFPSPFNESLSIEVLPPNPGEYTIQLVDLLGRSYQKQVVYSDGNQSIQMDLNSSNLPAGIAFIRVDGAGFHEVKQVVKQ